MGNRAVITTPERRIGLYLHWNGGRDTVEPLLRYCELKGYRPPSTDCYGWARLCQVIGNFFGGTLSVGIDAYERICKAGDDNGIYVIDGWRIVEREFPYDGFVEQSGYDAHEMLRAIDAAMPDDYLGEGMVTWTSGANKGLSQKVRTHTAAGVVTLVMPMVLPIAVGDQLAVVAGCRKRLMEDCKAKFGNVLNFQAEYHRPSPDTLTKPV